MTAPIRSDHAAQAQTGAHIGANTFLIGAQKAGTTYLAALLDQSPDICVSDPKEPQFYTTHYAEGFAHYARCFANPEARIRLDASTTYTFLRPRHKMDDPDAIGITDPVPERIAEAVPEAKFIYILRDPIKRAMSAYRHNHRNKPQPELPVSLVECFETHPMMGVASRYADQIERWFEVFPRERFLFLDFERVTRDTQAVLDEVAAFLELDLGEITLEEAERGKHGAHRVTAAGALMRGIMNWVPGLGRAARAIVPAGVKNQVIDRVTKTPSEIEFFDETAAAALFEEDRARTYALTGIRV